MPRRDETAFQPLAKGEHIHARLDAELLPEPLLMLPRMLEGVDRVTSRHQRLHEPKHDS